MRIKATTTLFHKGKNVEQGHEIVVSKEQGKILVEQGSATEVKATGKKKAATTKEGNGNQTAQ